MVYRSSGVQLSLLDRIAGTTAAADEFGQQLRRLQQLHADLNALAGMGDETERQEMQQLVDAVGLLVFQYTPLQYGFDDLQQCLCLTKVVCIVGQVSSPLGLFPYKTSLYV